MEPLKLFVSRILRFMTCTGIYPMSKPALATSFFGKTPAGEEITLYTLTNANGMEVGIINFGGIITRIKTADRQGQFADIALGFDELEPYLQASPYLGALIGRFGNRLAKGRFELDGKTYQLETNNGANHLHG